MAQSDTTTGDPLIAETEERGARAGRARAMTAANLFDLRRIIGGLFIVYGVILTITGLLDSDAEIKRAAGVHINLYTGLGMLVLGGLFLIWAFSRPLGEELVEAESEEGGDYPGRAAPRGVDAAALASHQRGGRPRRDRSRAGGGSDLGA
jgi:hypothetical protein